MKPVEFPEQMPWDEFGRMMKEDRLARREQRLRQLDGALAASDVEVLHQFCATHWRIAVQAHLFDYWPTTARWREFPNGTRTYAGGIAAIRRHLRVTREEQTDG